MSFLDDMDPIEPDLFDHFHEPSCNSPDTDEIMVALNALNLAQFQASRHPDDADLQVQEILARVRWGSVVARVCERTEVDHV